MEVPSVEFIQNRPISYDETLSERWQAYQDGLIFLHDNPPGGEEVVSAWSTARQMTLTGTTEIPAIRHMVDNFIKKRSGMDGEQLVQLDWRADQYYVGRDDPEYPHGYEEPQKWYEAISRLTQDVSTVQQMNSRREFYSVQTNDPRRAAGLLLAGTLFGDRWGDEGADILDLGCSVGLIPIQLKTNRLPGHQPRVEDKDLQGNTVDPAVKRALATIFAGKMAINQYWGIDMVDHDYVSSGWAIPGCQYPSEYGNKQLQADLGKLTVFKRQELKALGLDFFVADFTNPGLMKEFESEVAGWHPTMLTSQTTWYQMADPRSRQKLRVSNESLRKFLDPESGVEVRQEYAEPDPKNPQAVHFTPVYGPRSRYNLFIRDQTQPERGYQTYLRWDGGRLNTCRVGAPLIKRLKDTGRL